MKIKKLLMKEHPILFSTPMVKAILEGRKTMTRRIIKAPILKELPIDSDISDRAKEMYITECKYGHIGDILWVREAMVINKNSETYWPVADGYIKTADYEKVVPSIHVPKINSRIWLKITSVKVERLQDISSRDAIHEGIENLSLAAWKDYISPLRYCSNPRDSFCSLWISINGNESWEADPWVWVIEFEILSTTGKPEKL